MLSTTATRFCPLARCSRSLAAQVRLPRLGQERMLSKVDMPVGISPIFTYFSNTYATQLIETGIMTLQSTGFTPLGSYIAVGLAIRLATVPLMVYSEKLLAQRIHALQFLRRNILDKVGGHYGVRVVPSDESGQLTLATTDPKVLKHAAELVVKNVHEYSVRNGVQASRILLLKTLPMPLWLYSSFAIRNMVNVDFVPTVKGFFWMQNLNHPDPYYIFPICVGLVGFLTMQSQRVIPKGPQVMTKRVYEALLVLSMVVATGIMTKLPACITIYWLTVSLSGLAQSLLLRMPKVKRLLNIGKLPSDTATPIRDLLLFRRKEQAPIF